MFMILIVFKMIIEEVSDQMLYLHLPNIIIKDEKDMPNDLTFYWLEDHVTGQVHFEPGALWHQYNLSFSWAIPNSAQCSALAASYFS